MGCTRTHHTQPWPRQVGTAIGQGDRGSPGTATEGGCGGGGPRGHGRQSGLGFQLQPRETHDPLYGLQAFPANFHRKTMPPSSELMQTAARWSEDAQIHFHCKMKTLVHSRQEQAQGRGSVPAVSAHSPCLAPEPLQSASPACPQAHGCTPLPPAQRHTAIAHCIPPKPSASHTPQTAGRCSCNRTSELKANTVSTKCALKRAASC